MKAKGKERRKNKSRNMYIYVAVAVAIAVIAFSAIEQIMGPRAPKASAANYFKAEGIPTELDDRTTDQVLWLLQIRLNLTAVGGDAHRIVIRTPGMVPSDEWPDPIQELKQNETIGFSMPQEDYYFQEPVLAYKNDTTGYFEFLTSIDCDEASGRITVFLKE